MEIEAEDGMGRCNRERKDGGGQVVQIGEGCLRGTSLGETEGRERGWGRECGGLDAHSERGPPSLG